MIAAGLLLASACTSTEVTSTKDANYSTLVENLYLSSSISDALDDFEAEALATFDTSLTRASVAVHVQVLEASEASEASGASSAQVDVPFDSAQATDAVALLQIVERSRDETFDPGSSMPTAGGGTMMVGGGTNQTYIFDASLYDLESKERVWRAEVETTGDESSSQEKEGRVMAREVMQKLVMDGILPTRLMQHVVK